MRKFLPPLIYISFHERVRILHSRVWRDSIPAAKILGSGLSNMGDPGVSESRSGYLLLRKPILERQDSGLVSGASQLEDGGLTSQSPSPHLSGGRGF